LFEKYKKKLEINIKNHKLSVSDMATAFIEDQVSERFTNIQNHQNYTYVNIYLYIEKFET
jgi:hypothetical protein